MWGSFELEMGEAVFLLRIPIPSHTTFCTLFHFIIQLQTRDEDWEFFDCFEISFWLPSPVVVFQDNQSTSFSKQKNPGLNEVRENQPLVFFLTESGLCMSSSDSFCTGTGNSFRSLVCTQVSTKVQEIPSLHSLYSLKTTNQPKKPH